MGYKFLDHTADVKFVAKAETLEKVFEESAKALKETIHGEMEVLSLEKRNLEIEGSDLPNLLYKFLEEFIVLLDAEDFLLSKIDSITIDQGKNLLTARISGDKAHNYKFTNDVKAVTYNDMEVKQDSKKGIWKTQVVLDV